jgi:hypothetical protein
MNRPTVEPGDPSLVVERHRRVDYTTLSGPIDVALIGCGKSKRMERSRASELYTGRLFRAAYAHALTVADDVYILSALHGLLSPHEEVDPYDFSMTKMLPHHRSEWGEKVVSILLMQYPMTKLSIVFLAGRQYVDPVFKAALTEGVAWNMADPLVGMDLWERIAYLKERTDVVS